jgi:hypothetical protein
MESNFFQFHIKGKKITLRGFQMAFRGFIIMKKIKKPHPNSYKFAKWCTQCGKWNKRIEGDPVRPLFCGFCETSKMLRGSRRNRGTS